MDYTIEGYDIRIEVREDGLANYSISYITQEGDDCQFGDGPVELSEALEAIITAVNMKLAGAF